MSEQQDVDGSEQNALSAASEAPLNGDAHAKEKPIGEIENPVVIQEQPDAKNDSMAVQNNEAQNGDSKPSTWAVEKKKKFPWFRKDKNKGDSGTSSKNESHEVGNPVGDQPANGNDHRETSKTAGSADPKTAEAGDGTKQKKQKWWKRKLCPRQPSINTEHPEAAS